MKPVGHTGLGVHVISRCFPHSLLHTRPCLKRSYGSPAAQFKAFWDATGSLWQKGSLVGKAVTTFIGTGTQGGGQETTHLTCERPVPE